MANVLIIDDNRSNSAFLKMSLMRGRHHVQRSETIREAIFPSGGTAPDLVLINQAIQNFTGWELFNYLKQLAPGLPAMVYVLENNRVDSAKWICKAVDAACEKADASPTPPAAGLARHGSATMVPIRSGKSPYRWKP